MIFKIQIIFTIQKGKDNAIVLASTVETALGTWNIKYNIYVYYTVVAALYYQIFIAMYIIHIHTYVTTVYKYS